jgi:SAM-dependent methyltransferase
MSHDTNTAEYADYLVNHQKRFISKIVQLPYRMHLKFLRLGKTLDIGCGAGRNLKACPEGSIGLDHNPLLVSACRGVGLNAMGEEEWVRSRERYLAHFDSILLSHVAEHMTELACVALIQQFLPYLKSGGKIVLICPQEAGYALDATHVEFMDFDKMKNILLQTGAVEIQKAYSFPFVRKIGNFFRANEFVVMGQKK